MEVELNEYLDRLVEKNANQLHLCHRGVMIPPWSEEELIARQTNNTDNYVGGDNTEVLKAESPSFIFLVAILAFVGQIASILIGMLSVSWKNHVKTTIFRPKAAGSRPAL